MNERRCGVLKPLTKQTELEGGGEGVGNEGSVESRLSVTKSSKIIT